VAFVFSASQTGSWRVERPVFAAEKCNACALCAKFCPAGLVTVDKGNHFVTFDLTYCKGCGICMSACACECITMVPEKDLV
jgi:2-oxoacid:acceptor oxidoreductase delta subunit (pyruvate/2-ketoisovalerate family)